MIDCPNVEMRDRLPDLANDSLDPADRELVLVHLSECTACTAEIEILRTTRLILLTTTPKVNVAGIVSALPRYGQMSLPRGAKATRGFGWTNSWRAAAAVTFLAAGFGSYELLNNKTAVAPIDSLVAVADSSVGLGLNGALVDLSEAELTALATDIATIDALPSTDVESTSSMRVPPILPDSIIQQELEIE